ncbi:MAG: hypothetical protein QOE34_1061 [Verrucomicrobiota bacterium]|jgi:hypothetical protein
MLALATTYRVVFDITKDARPDDIAGGCFTATLLLAAGIVLLVIRRSLPAILRLWFPALVVAVGILGIVGLLFRTVPQPSELAAAYRAGKCEVVEGTVTQFHPMPAREHDSESFVVAGRRFHYSDYSMTAGFHQSVQHGGPMREGLQVRIHHLGNDIAKLEIDDTQASNNTMQRTPKAFGVADLGSR